MVRGRRRQGQAAPAPRRGPGRPATRGGKLAAWIEQHQHDRADIADKLGIDRRHLDHIAREDRRPSLELALAIEKLTKGEVPVSYLVLIPKHSGD